MELSHESMTAGPGVFTVSSDDTVEIYVLTERWRRMWKLKPKHVPFLPGVSCSRSTVFNKSPVISHNVVHCVVFLWANDVVTIWGSCPEPTRFLIYVCKVRVLQGSINRARTRVYYDSFRNTGLITTNGLIYDEALHVYKAWLLNKYFKPLDVLFCRKVWTLNILPVVNSFWTSDSPDQIHELMAS